LPNIPNPDAHYPEPRSPGAQEPRSPGAQEPNIPNPGAQEPLLLPIPRKMKIFFMGDLTNDN